MKSGRFKLGWKDAVNAIIMIVIANLLMGIMSAAQDKLPTWHELQVTLINSLKYGIIPYLLKNFFTDDVKVAQKTLENAKQ